MLSTQTFFHSSLVSFQCCFLGGFEVNLFTDGRVAPPLCSMFSCVGSACGFASPFNEILTILPSPLGAAARSQTVVSGKTSGSVAVGDHYRGQGRAPAIEVNETSREFARWVY